MGQQHNKQVNLKRSPYKAMQYVANLIKMGYEIRNL